MSDISELVQTYRRFVDPSLTSTLSKIEATLQGASPGDLDRSLSGIGATEEALSAAIELKRVVGQINVAIHALGILLCLPHILEPDEKIEFVSLGAGNTGRAFDLETNLRVAEFKFIDWKGGSETIRQNSVFKDFFLLVEHSTSKRKFLYLLDIDRPIRFLRGRRALQSVLKDARLARQFRQKYGDQYRTVGEYFMPRQQLVSIQDVSDLLPKVFIQAVMPESVSKPIQREPALSPSPQPVESQQVSRRTAKIRTQFAAFHGKHLQTSRDKIGYKIGIDERGLTFTPDSTGRLRMEPWQRVERVLQRYAETKSLRPKDYMDITRNSSYLLPVIQRLFSTSSS